MDQHVLRMDLMKTSMICAQEDGVNRPSYKIQSKPILEKSGGKLGHKIGRLGHLIVVGYVYFQ